MAEKEYIERDAALKNLKNHGAICEFGQQLIKNFPAADVAPVRHGHWIKTANTWTHDYNEKSKPIYYCTLCGRYEKLKEPYCNCGAKMDGGEEE